MHTHKLVDKIEICDTEAPLVNNTISEHSVSVKQDHICFGMF